MPGYGQFCPIAKAMELLDERWTLLVIRELGAGSRHFNEIRRGLPRMSPALLSKRLRALTRAGLVDRIENGNRISYVLTTAGQELEPIIDALGIWGMRWIPDLGDDDLDPHLLMWDVHRNVDPSVLGGERAVLRFTFTDVPSAARDWWLLIDADSADVCDFDPGHPVFATIQSDLRTMTRVWRGDTAWNDAARAGEITVRGPSGASRVVVRLLRMSYFASVPRPPRPAPPTPELASVC